MKNSTEYSKKKSTGILICLALVFFIASFFLLFEYSRRASNIQEPVPLSFEEQEIFYNTLKNSVSFPGSLITFPLQAQSPHIAGLRSLPYPTSSIDISLYAKSAIIIDTATGCILYEKNADEIIPPASMTKVVVMYVVFQEITKGTVSLSDFVYLPPNSWAINAPPGSSLMFLSEGHKVTVEELLRGLAVMSGNDAAMAIAHHISGSVEAFCKRMNEEMISLGLTHTRFVEPSGYSELNVTTAREFAEFARVYLENYPESLALFHSQEKMTYPLGKNIPGQKDDGLISGVSITQYATNRLLSTLKGSDGLKTGYIDESGFNIALTAKRDTTRFLSVTMGGPGKNSAQGNRYRSADGTKLMEWAFSAFKTVYPRNENSNIIKVIHGSSNSVKLIEAWDNTLTSPIQYAENVICTQEIPQYLKAPIYVGQQYGKNLYTSDGVVLQEIPLLANRTIHKGSFLKIFIDTLSYPFSKLFNN